MMTGLSTQDIPHNPDEKKYSESDLQHIVARRWAQGEIERLSAEVLKLHKDILESSTIATAESKATREMLLSLPNTLAAQIHKCREEVREETKNLYPTRLENLEMRNHIESQVKEVDTTLGKQIAAVDAKITKEVATIQTEIAGIKSDLAKQWLKIVGPITGVIGFAMVLSWYLEIFG